MPSFNDMSFFICLGNKRGVPVKVWSSLRLFRIYENLYLTILGIATPPSNNIFMKISGPPDSSISQRIRTIMRPINDVILMFDISFINVSYILTK